MAAAANIATSAMWFCEDFGSLVKRGYDIHKGTYKPQKKDLITIEFKDIKTSEDTEKFVDESLKRFGQNVMTKNAFKEMLPFVAFDFIQGELYGAYQDAHPASSYHSTKEFLEQTKKLLISSCLAGLITYPLQDSMDQIPGNIAKFFANRLLKPNAKLKSQQKAVPTYLPSNGVNHG
jgi:hypothetical protein